jgi:hypothetical protein
MSAYTAESSAGRVLLALRAGPTESQALNERFSFFPSVIGELCRQRLVVKDGYEYRLTAAGRAACPLRNPPKEPKSTDPDAPETKEHTMKQKVTEGDVYDAIRAAGSAGTTVKKLSFALGVSDQTILNHVKRLASDPHPAVFRPRWGLLVSTSFKAAQETDSAADAALEAEVAKIEREYNDFKFYLDPPAQEPETPRARAAADGFVEALRESAKRRGMVAEPDRPEDTGSQTSCSQVSQNQQAWVEDIIITDPDMAEFAVFSSGGLDIYYEDSTVSMTAPVLRKLRDFLGLFAEAA